MLRSLEMDPVRMRSKGTGRDTGSMRKEKLGGCGIITYQSVLESQVVDTRPANHMQRYYCRDQYHYRPMVDNRIMQHDI